MSQDPVLSVRDLTVDFATARGPRRAVDGVSLDVRPGEIVAIVGESGSGKSVTAMSVLGLQPKNAVLSGEITVHGRSVIDASERQLRGMRGQEISLVLQNPMNSLNPVRSVGAQLDEARYIHHRDTRSKDLRVRTIESMRQVGLPEAEQRATQYPHEFSGGMRQRAMIAMSVINDPDIVIADEPTTALDVTVQAQILDLLDDVRRRSGTGVLLITHDLAVVAQIADRVVVMYAGKVVESGNTADVLERPEHPYTLGLIKSLPQLAASTAALEPIPGSPPDPLDRPSGCPFHPRCEISRGRSECRDIVPELRPTGGADHQAACHFVTEVKQERERIRLTERVRRDGEQQARPADDRPTPTMGPAVVEVRDLVKDFPLGRSSFGRKGRHLRAVDSVNLTIHQGETLALVGESGSGKSTVARLMTMLTRPTSGEITITGVDVWASGRQQRRALRRELQIVFQDPYSALNPRRTVEEIVSEPLRIHGTPRSRRERAKLVAETLEQVGLRDADGSRHPHEFSGGQRQRISVARAIVLRPKTLVLDEPTSALDVSIQAQVLNLLEELKQTLGLSYLFVSHDLSVVRHVADRIAVMRQGEVVELGATDAVFRDPQHDYTQRLLSSIPRLGRRGDGGADVRGPAASTPAPAHNTPREA